MQVVLVYLQWFRYNSLLKSASQPTIVNNSLNLSIFGVQGRSRSSMLVPVESSSAVLVMISSKSVSICNRFHDRLANSGKITIFKGVPLFDALIRGESSPSGTKLPHQKPKMLGYHMVKTWSLYLIWPRIRTGSWQTDTETDRQNSHSQYALSAVPAGTAVARKYV